MAIINISVAQFLPITQGDPDSGIIGQIVEQPLYLTQSVQCSHQNVSTNQPFNVSQAVAVTQILNLDVVNILSLTQTAAPTYNIEAATALVITQQAASVNPQAVIQGLAITHSVVPSRALASTLTVSQAVVLVGTYTAPATTSLTITQSVSYFKKDAVKTFNIVVPSPSANIPVNVPSDSLVYGPVILTYGSTTVTLVVPELGDIDSISLKRVKDQTRGGDTIIFRDPIWSITEILKFKFTNLTRNRSQELLRFFADTIGLSVQLTDHFGVVWNGIIITPDAQVVCTNDKNCGSYEVEFDFQVLQ
jgi:hypothetical protein